MPPTLTDTVDAVEERVLALIQRYTALLQNHQSLQARVDELESERLRLQSCLAAARGRVSALIDRLPAESQTSGADSDGANRRADPA